MMKGTIGAFLWSLGAQIVPAEADVPHYTEIPHDEAVRMARDEWIAAKTYFNAVTETDLVDYAIHRVDAAERKYVYLLKVARADGEAQRRISRTCPT
jgi:hypothetical protein